MEPQQAPRKKAGDNSQSPLTAAPRPKVARKTAGQGRKVKQLTQFPTQSSVNTAGSEPRLLVHASNHTTANQVPLYWKAALTPYVAPSPAHLIKHPSNQGITSQGEQGN